MALKFISAEEAASLVKHNDNVGFSGFTHAGCPKVVPVAIAKLAEEEHAKGNSFKIGVFTGASTGDSIDGSLTRAKAIKFRTPYQTNKDMRVALNNGEFDFFDLHLSQLAQEIRYGFLGKINVAVVEACDVTESGEIVPTTGVGITPTICRLADIVIVELNKSVPTKLRGIHDMYELQDPPKRREIPIYEVQNRVGLEYVKVDPAKIYVVETNKDGEGGGFAPVDDVTARIGNNVAEFFVSELKAGRIPAHFLPIQSGVGNIANAVLASMGSNPAIPRFEVYTEVIQDAVIDMMQQGNISFASGCSLTVSNEVLHKFYEDLSFFKNKLVLRPSEISNNPGLARRLGIIALNTAIEVDIFGNVNSTHVNGTKMMNGIGGSGDFTRNSYLSIFLTPSTAKNGTISCIVPKVTHEDHNEHSVKIIVSEYGVADLRGKGPRNRAEEIIEKCAHPDYRPLLHDYLNRGVKGHIPQDLYACFAFHKALKETGSMINADFSKL
ncbi:MAG TPA: succinate CoA transferase [Fermentimonas caenicola]|jgi:succinate CoA transferase|uniref:succinate CoA transferase n=1 Tax=Lascolabacillus TaxID=1924067 RepID=UPI0006B2FDA4|nr:MULTISPECIES: succinate CoA transferase [Lascolabacillus]MBP6175671.1 succinate CoA transferase [Fermentimonas sp.]MDI9626874.1 succinate CoA transferase [Bacteroidota bacterium]HHU42588.1 succinate CoA transferase [Fermentimonas caenicola]MBP6197175.1 succinate CoA transferase [Fermentimonas sp.]MCK9501463.1 acetyl-CoA hydrolase/transferase family protein [Lascolabacillus sp.]